jgi:hypothetical protein
LREELPGKEEDPVPELDMPPICAMAKKTDNFCAAVACHGIEKESFLCRDRTREEASAAILGGTTAISKECDWAAATVVLDV